MKESLRIGLNFGSTSGVITTLGLMVGLHSGTHSQLAVAGGILTIAIADALSDALGIHVSEESEGIHTSKQIWISTVATFVTKFLMALTFLVPVVLLNLPTAIAVSIIWGLGVIVLLSYNLAKSQGTNPRKVIAEHLVIAVAVIIITHFVGDWISESFQ